MRYCILTFLLSIYHLTALAQDKAYVVCKDSSLYLVDASICSTELIGSTNLLLFDIAFNPINNTYYGIAVDSTLNTINISNGALSYIGTMPIRLNSLTFDKNGVLYGMSSTNDFLYTINTTTAVVTNRGSTGTGIYSTGDLTFRNGQLYLSGIPNYLVAIDHVTPSNSYSIGRISSIGNVFGLTSIGCESNIYAFSSNNIYALNPSNLLQANLQCSGITPSSIYGVASSTELYSTNKVNFGNDTILCNGETLTLDASAPNATYQWNDNSNLPTLEVTQPGIYSVVVTNSNTCISKDTILVSFSPKTAIHLGNDTILCQGDTLTLATNASNATLIWQDNSKNSTFQVTQQGSYSVEANVNGCRVNDTILVIYTPMLNVDLGKDTTLCHGDTLTLDARSNLNLNYRWQDNSNNPLFQVIQQGIYSVEAEINGCTTNDTILVNYTPKENINLGNDTTLCDGETLTLEVIIPNAVFTWQNNSSNAVLQVSQQGRYEVDVFVNGCTTSDTILVNYSPRAQVDLGTDTTLCKGDTIRLDASSNNPTLIYSWQDTSSDSILQVTQQGVYWVQVNSNGCIAKDEIIVLYEELETSETLTETFCAGDDLSLEATSPNGSYTWQDGSKSNAFRVYKTGTYWAEISNSCGTSRKTFIVNSEDCDCLIFYPNAFSPNGDAQNDFFTPVFDCNMVDYELIIFNRWGETVFETNIPLKGWDGNFKGQKADPGRYVYRLRYKSDQAIYYGDHNGTVLLIR